MPISTKALAYLKYCNCRFTQPVQSEVFSFFPQKIILHGLGAGLGPKQRTLTMVHISSHSAVYHPCSGLAFSHHRNRVFLVLT